MSISEFMPLIFGALGGLVGGVIFRWWILSDQERRAWGSGRAELSRAQRREIRRSVSKGRPVGDRALAAAAVRLGEAVAVSTLTWWPWSSTTPQGVVIFGRIFFPVLGVASVALGLTDRDPAELFSGVLLLSFTILYLPPTLRRIAARKAERDRRVHASIDANRQLATVG
jgi:hypothetical protein